MIYVVRHGETDLNKEGRLQGRLGLPLNENGIKQAEYTSSRLDVFDLGEADKLKKDDVKWNGVIPDSSVYKGVEQIQSYIKRVFEFMNELEVKVGVGEVNVLLSGHRCTTGCMGAYFEGIPEDGNILRFSSNNGEFKTYNFNGSHHELGRGM